MFRAPAVLAATALLLAGCAGRAASVPQTSAATPSLPCSLPYGTRVSLVSPEPGSRGNGTGPIVLVASRTLPKTVGIVATDRKGAVTPVATLERLPAPAHVKRAPYADPVYYRAVGAALQTHRHYTLALDDEAQNGCAPYAAMTGEARFST